MSEPRMSIGQFQIGTTLPSVFGTPEAGQVWKVMQAHGALPKKVTKSAESPVAKQGMWHLQQEIGRTDGTFPMKYRFRGKGTGTYNECGLILLNLLGKQHSPLNWNETLDPTMDGSSSTTQCEITAGAFSETDIGALFAIPNGTGDLRIRRLKSFSALSHPGMDNIGWDIALDSAQGAASGLHVYAIKTFYFDGNVDHQSLEFRQHGEHDDDFVAYYGCNGTGSFKIAPTSDDPRVTMELKWNFARNEWVSGAALVAASDDNKAPMSVAAGSEAIMSTYTATNRDTTRTLLHFKEFEFDIGHDLKPIEDGLFTNGIAGWQNVVADGMLKGSIVVPWAKSHELAFAAGTSNHMLMSWGKGLLTGMGAISIPHINRLKPEVVDRGGIQCLKVPFVVRENIDPTSVTPNPVDASVLVIGQGF